MKITYWSDFACPYCYIGEIRLKKAISELPELGYVDIEMRAFRLDPAAGKHATADTQTRYAHKYGISYEQAASSIEMISEIGRAEGIDLKYATTRFTSTTDAHRLTKLAQTKEDPKIADRIVERLFEAYFVDNKELSDKQLLHQIGEECGLKSDEICTALNSGKFRKEIISDEDEAVRYGIHAVPFFIIGNYGVSGAQTTEDLKNILLKVRREELITKDTQQIKNSDNMSCNLDGCDIEF